MKVSFVNVSWKSVLVYLGSKVNKLERSSSKK